MSKVARKEQRKQVYKNVEETFDAVEFYRNERRELEDTLTREERASREEARELSCEAPNPVRG